MANLERALIIRKPWIDLILSGQKSWEMRSRLTNVRGKVGLIESGSGLVVGSVEIINSFTLNPDCFAETRLQHRVDDLDLLKKWGCVWSLIGAKRFKAPIPYNHPRGAVVWVNIENLEIKYATS